MENKKGKENSRNPEGPVLLVAVDFSNCSVLALRKAKDLQDLRKGRIVVLHVIDHAFVEQCIRDRLGNENDIKKKLFLGAKSKLLDFLHKEGIQGNHVEMVVCEGTPCIEINRMAVRIDAEMIIMGSQGSSGDMKSIFFGSTAERTLRFITRPVLCVPPQAEYRMS